MDLERNTDSEQTKLFLDNYELEIVHEALLLLEAMARSSSVETDVEDPDKIGTMLDQIGNALPEEDE